MKNFKDIKENINYSFFINGNGKIPTIDLTVEHDLSKINIPSNSLIFENKNIVIGSNLSINNIGELNYEFNRLDTNQLNGLLGNISIKEDSLSIENLSNINSNNLLSTNGEILIGNNLILNNNRLSTDLPEVLVSVGLNSYKNPSNIIGDGIYFLDNNSFNQITCYLSVNRAYIINNDIDINYCNNIPIYPNEICLFSYGEKIKTNYIGQYKFDNY